MSTTQRLAGHRPKLTPSKVELAGTRRPGNRIHREVDAIGGPLGIEMHESIEVLYERIGRNGHGKRVAVAETRSSGIFSIQTTTHSPKFASSYRSVGQTSPLPEAKRG
jgi:hypothetical protein